ncbi:MAG: phosphocholine cytidylyltransferase family protein [Gammaproteobacteria bacterium]|jgi:2-aminoethylphosphonate-pyruvate transaminase|nr:phosphocholine cytidylyltransferase family protein [Gammaproteobacteria bacterium]
MIRTAVILAAGMGTRLAGEVEDYPKGFLRLGRQSIIEESIERLVAAGIQDIVIVTGHCADHYDRFAAGQDGLVRTVHNPHFADSGSMYSLYCTRDVVDHDFLLLESDLIYQSRALTELLIEPAPDAILLSGPTGAGDEVWVQTRDGNLVAMSKDRSVLTGPVAGELVGITKISTPLFALMREIAAQAFTASLHFDYETDCLVAAGERRPICCPLIADLVWTEIDDPGHLQRAREQIYPQIEKMGG